MTTWVFNYMPAFIELLRWNPPSHHQCGTKEKHTGGRGWAFCVPHRQKKGEAKAKAKHDINCYFLKAKCWVVGRVPHRPLSKVLDLQAFIKGIGGLLMFAYKDWACNDHWAIFFAYNPAGFRSAQASSRTGLVEN